MQKTTYQRPEIRDANDTVIQSGAYGKNTAFCNSQNTGILDYINNNLEALNDNKVDKNTYNTGYVAASTTSDVDAPTNTLTNVLSFSLTKGLWIVQGVTSFSPNASGYRALGVSTNTTAVQMDRFAIVRVPAASGVTTNLQINMILNVTSNSQTFYLNTHQTSGKQLTLSGGYRAVKLV